MNQPNTFYGKLLIIISFMLFHFNGNGQEIMQEIVSKDYLKTVRIFNAAVDNSYPLIELNSGEQISLEFDDLSGKSRDIMYAVYQCDYDWKLTTMLRSEYLEGLYQDYLTSRKFSIGTYKSYVHYNILFPNGNTKILKSGNYIVKVYEAGNEKNIILIKRFYVYDQQVSISGDVFRPSITKFNNTHQQFNCSIDVSAIPVNDIFRDIHVVFKQNFRSDNEIRGLAPRMLSGSVLQYNYDEEMLFPGQNEFRPIDLHDVRMRGFGVRYFNLDSNYSANLYQDESKQGQSFTQLSDQNGMYKPLAQGREGTYEGDYIYNYFHLKSPKLDDKDVYVFGALSNWKLDNRYKMTYSARDFEYQATILLKQGYYDFCYATYSATDGLSTADFEGNHWETENNYAVLVYWRPAGMNYDLLVGRGLFNSFSKK